MRVRRYRSPAPAGQPTAQAGDLLTAGSIVIGPSIPYKVRNRFVFLRLAVGGLAPAAEAFLMTDYTAARINMVESQVRPNKVTDLRLLHAMLNLPRERFVPE